MKKITLIIGIFLSATINFYAQKFLSIVNQQDKLLINDSLSLYKNGEIQIYLPTGKDFVFVKQKKSGFNTQLLGKVAGVIGTGASAVGVGSGSVEVLRGATKVINGTNAIQYGADAINKIQNLPISNDAKKIAGTKMQIIDWEFTDDGWVVNAKYGNKKYQIYLQEALMAGEVMLSEKK